VILMKIKSVFALSSLICVLFLLTACANNITPQSGLYFNNEKYTVVGEELGGNRNIPYSFEELEAGTRYLPDGSPHPFGLIVKCSVAGESINRIIEPSEKERDSSVIYGLNHVLTPVKIEEIIFSGEDVDVEAGKTYYLCEPFFYIDKSTPEYFERYGEDTVYSAEYTPIQKGNQYLMYLTYKDDEIYNFDGEKVLGTVGLQEAVYCLASEAEAKESVIAGDDNYWRLWNDVAQNYR
jgi:hypothetical protein